MSHFSYYSAPDKADVFRAMFLDSNIAQSLSCDPTNLSNLICFGIASYFKQLLTSDLKKASWFEISFDESLNLELQQEQMDFT